MRVLKSWVAALGVVLLVVVAGSCARDEVTGVPAVSGERTAGATALTNVILFSTEEFGGFPQVPQLSVMNPNGSGRRRITTDGQEYGTPAISPDGMRIAFTRFTPEVNGSTIYIMNADGTGQMPVIHRSTLFDGEPVWSPDGMQLAFSSWTEGPFGPYSRIFVVNVDGTGLRQLTPDVDNNVEYAADFGLAWSPDGTQIVFVRNGRLHLINADGTGFIALPNEDLAQTPSWSPDGTRIAYASLDPFGDIHIRNRDGSNLTVVTTGPGQDFSPRWSPDGRRLVFVRAGDDFISQLYTVNVDGTRETRLSPGGFSEYSPDWGPAPGSGVSGVEVAVTPSTRTLDIGESQQYSAVVRSHSGGVLGNASVRWESSNPAVASVSPSGVVTGMGRGLVQIRAVFGGVTGRAEVQIAELTLRNRIVFATTERGSFDLGVIRPDGTDRHVLTGTNNGARVFLEPDISPDGRRIAYQDLGDLYLMNADGTGITPFLMGPPSNGSPHWSPDGMRLAVTRTVSTPRGEQTRIFVINADGTGLHQVSPEPADPNFVGGDGWPSWASDGSKLAFTRNGELFTINADGTGMTQLPTPLGAQATAWSPDGRWIAYQSLSFLDLPAELFVVSPDGANSIRLTNSPETETSPSWSPDSRRIVFARWVDGMTAQLFIINVDGTALIRITDPNPAQPFAYDDDPAWSPVP
ncbi:MAG TPA: Ig-like domain-containing protein [Gemmatimonadales bacterium]|nr:Ig-like domain-containing protein [Gemmatimonadales bacterium]